MMTKEEKAAWIQSARDSIDISVRRMRRDQYMHWALPEVDYSEEFFDDIVAFYKDLPGFRVVTYRHDQKALQITGEFLA